MIKLFILLLLFNTSNAFATTRYYQSIPDSTQPSVLKAKDTMSLREKARKRIRTSGGSFAASAAVFGAGFRLAEKDRKKNLDADPKRKNALVPVLFVLSGLLVVLGVILFISWVGMNKGRKESRVSLQAPRPFSYARCTQWSSAVRIRIGKQ